MLGGLLPGGRDHGTWGERDSMTTHVWPGSSQPGYKTREKGLNVVLDMKALIVDLDQGVQRACLTLARAGQWELSIPSYRFAMLTLDVKNGYRVIWRHPLGAGTQAAIDCREQLPLDPRWFR